MKKNYILLPICLFSISLAACNKPAAKEEKNYNIVNFNYNTEDNKETYLSVVVAKNQVLDAPKAPELANLLFEDWYQEPTCENKYLRWGLEIDKDFTLYANWTSYDSLTIEQKVAEFQAKLKELGKDAVRVNQTCEATVAYPFMGEDAIFFVKDKYVYKRYKNITEKEYYQVNNDNSESLYGKEQFYYDNNNFYDIYVDYEDNENNEKKTAPFKKESLEGFLSIDFQNLFHTCEDDFVYYAGKYGEKTDLFEYTFTGNYTTLKGSLENYSYSEGYYYAFLSEQVGDYITQEYAYNFGLTFENGKIRRANVQIAYLYAIGQDVYQYNEETSVYEFYYNNGVFSDFTGDLLR